MNIDKTLVIGLAAGAGALTAIGAGIAAMFTGKSQVSSKQVVLTRNIPVNVDGKHFNRQPENETPMWDPQDYFLYNGEFYGKSRYTMIDGKPYLKTALSTASSDERKTRTPEQKKQTSSSSSSVDLSDFPDAQSEDEWRFPSNMFKTPSPYYRENPFSNTVLTDRAENEGGPQLYPVKLVDGKFYWSYKPGRRLRWLDGKLYWERTI